MQPFSATLRRLDCQRLQPMRFEVIPLVLGFLRPIAYPLACRHHKQRQVVALSVLCGQNVIAQAQEIALPLPWESKCVQRLFFSRCKEVQGIARRLHLEELPDRPDLHELGGFFLHFFHALKELDGFRIALRKALFEVAAETHVPPIEHERVDVAPDFAEIGHQADLAVQVLHSRNGEVGSNTRRSGHTWNFFDADRRRHAKTVSGSGMFAHHCCARRRIHQFVHQAQAGHGVFGVAHGLAIARGNLRLCEFRGKRGAADE